MSGITRIILSDDPESEDIQEDLTPEAIEKASEKIANDVPKQPSSH